MTGGTWWQAEQPSYDIVTWIRAPKRLYSSHLNCETHPPPSDANNDLIWCYNFRCNFLCCWSILKSSAWIPNFWQEPEQEKNMSGCCWRLERPFLTVETTLQPWRPSKWISIMAIRGLFSLGSKDGVMMADMTYIWHCAVKALLMLAK